MPKQRKLSRFLCRELLYDYIENILDEDRKRAVEDFLKQDQEISHELEAMRQAQKYCEALSKTRLSGERIEQLSAIKPKVELILDRFSWKNWPDPLKWSTQALAISAVAMVIGLSLPWYKIGGLVELGRQKDKQAELPPFEVAGLVTDGDTDYETEGRVKEVLSEKEDSSDEPSSPEVEQAEMPEEAPRVAAIPETQPKPEPEKKKQEEPALQGMLYRILMSHHQTQKITVDIREKIRSFGGSRAGQVELGWRRENGNYFHFSIPEKHYDEFIAFLENYGSMTVYKNPHERVMPEGIRRIILWIEDRPKRDNDEDEDNEGGAANSSVSSQNADEE